MLAECEVTGVTVRLPSRRPSALGGTNGADDIELEQFLEEAKAVAHRPLAVMTVGGETAPTPAVTAVLDDIERRCARIVIGIWCARREKATLYAELELFRKNVGLLGLPES